MSDDPDRLTKAQVCDRLKIGERTLHKHVKAGDLEPGRWRAPGESQWRTVFLVEDVDRLAAKLAGGPPTPFLVPPTAGGSNGNGTHPAAGSTSPMPGVRLARRDDPLQQVFALVLRALEAPQAAQDPQGPQGPTPAYVDKTEALAIAGVSYGALRAAVQAGEVKQRGRRYRRTDLEAL